MAVYQDWIALLWFFVFVFLVGVTWYFLLRRKLYAPLLYHAFSAVLWAVGPLRDIRDDSTNELTNCTANFSTVECRVSYLGLWLFMIQILDFVVEEANARFHCPFSCAYFMSCQTVMVGPWRWHRSRYTWFLAKVWGLLVLTAYLVAWDSSLPWGFVVLAGSTYALPLLGLAAHTLWFRYKHLDQFDMDLDSNAGSADLSPRAQQEAAPAPLVMGLTPDPFLFSLSVLFIFMVVTFFSNGFMLWLQLDDPNSSNAVALSWQMYVQMIVYPILYLVTMFRWSSSFNVKKRLRLMRKLEGGVLMPRSALPPALKTEDELKLEDVGDLENVENVGSRPRRFSIDTELPLGRFLSSVLQDEQTRPLHAGTEDSSTSLHIPALPPDLGQPPISFPLSSLGSLNDVEEFGSHYVEDALET